MPTTSAITFSLLQSSNTSQFKLESDEILTYTDILCEGPVEGFVDKYGNLLNYTRTGGNSNFILGKGLYYNEVPVIDSKLNKFNFINSNFSFNYGDEFNTADTVSTVFKYDVKLYLNEINIASQIYTNLFTRSDYDSFFSFAFSQNEQNEYSKVNVDFTTSNLSLINSTENINITYSNFVGLIETARLNCREFTHKVKNKYADLLRVELGLDQLYTTNNDGDVLNNKFIFAFELSSDKTFEKIYGITQVVGISRGDFKFHFDIPITIDSISNEKKFITIIPLSQKISPTEARKALQVSVSSISEIITNNNFTYPYTVFSNCSISSKHFSNDPIRSYDLKLLKIKIPSNYDAEAREYVGTWSGKFDNLLKWSDNPAWAYYDICTNSRYGLGNTNITDKDLNKWELYKISKYCDALVKTQIVKKQKEDLFFIKESEENKNCIYLQNQYSYTLEDLIKKYNPVNGGSSTVNGGFGNSVIFLYDLEDSLNNTSEIGLKKIVWSIEETENNEFKFTLINDFGPKKMFERIGNDSFYQEYVNTTLTESQPTVANLNTLLSKQNINTEFGAKNFILEKFKTTPNSYSLFIKESIFNDEILNGVISFGKCYPKELNYPDVLEPRFSINVLLNEESETLKLLNDFCSIFRGLTYYKNNLINATIDIDKDAVYIFNNTNVKNGDFSYSSGSLEGMYTVAKVLFKDKNDNFNDSVEIIEDTEMMSNYGIIVKEIIGFGVTSRDQARRIGSWLLLTNRFENQMITFTTDLQGIYLKPSDIIKVTDQYRNNLSIQGRILDLNVDDLYVVVDRKVDLSFTNGILSFLKEAPTVDNIDSISSNTILTFQVDRIENNSGKIYLKPISNDSQDIENGKDIISQIKKTTLFIITKSESENDNLYKVISISESDSNEYSVSAIRHEKSKYEFLDLNYFTYKQGNIENNSIILSANTDVKEINLPSGTSYFSLNSYSRFSMANQLVDYSFLEYSDVYTKKYDILSINCTAIFSAIQNSSGSAYYENIKTVLNDGGGLLFKLMFNSQSIIFKMKSSSISNKKIFLGMSDVSEGSASTTSIQYGRVTKDLKIYLFNKNDQIVEVNSV